jgi:hypothetical protein
MTRFGQTVNIAARVQSLADSRAIFATKSGVENPQVSKMLENEQAQADRATRGLARDRRQDDGISNSLSGLRIVEKKCTRPGSSAAGGRGTPRGFGQPDSPSNWWHYQPFAAASTLSAARAIAELQVARKADAHLPQSLTIAVDGDAFGRQSIIRADKRIDDLTGSDA